MKRILIILSLTSFSIMMFPQTCVTDIIGVWQNNSSEIGSAWLDNYQFYRNNRFVFNLSQYDALKRIVSIKGNYRLTNDTIFFKIDHTTENIGGHIERDNFTSIHGSWALSGNITIKEMEQRDTEETWALIKYLNENCILIDGNKFYRISKNPNEY